MEDNLSCNKEEIDEDLSYKERMEDAKASGAEEGRGKLRKAAGSRKQTSIRRYPNAGTHPK